MNTEAKFQEIIELAEANNLHTEIHNNTVTVYLVSTADFNTSNGRPVAIRANIRTVGRKSIAFNYVGTRTRSITRNEAIDTIITANN